MSLIDQEILEGWKKLVCDYIAKEDADAAAARAKENYEDRLRLFTPVLKAAYPERKDLTKKICNAYRLHLRPYVLSPAQLNLLEANARRPTPEAKAENNRIVNRVAYVWKKMVDSIYGRVPDEEGSDSEPEEIQGPSRHEDAKRKFVDAISSLDPKESIELLKEHVSKKVKRADMRQYEQYVDGLGRLFTDLTESRDEGTRRTERTPQRSSVASAVATPAVNTPANG